MTGHHPVLLEATDLARMMGWSGPSASARANRWLQRTGVGFLVGRRMQWTGTSLRKYSPTMFSEFVDAGHLLAPANDPNWRENVTATVLSAHGEQQRQAIESALALRREAEEARKRAREIRLSAGRDHVVEMAPWNIDLSEAMREAQASEPTGLIYFVTTNEAVKVGYTARPLAHRLCQMQVGCPQELTVLCAIPGTRALEKLLHARLLRFHLRGEWFIASKELLWLARELSERVVGSVPWSPQ